MEKQVHNRIIDTDHTLRRRDLIILRWIRGIQLLIALICLPYWLDALRINSSTQSWVKICLGLLIGGSWAFVDGIFFEFPGTITRLFIRPDRRTRKGDIILLICLALWALLHERKQGCINIVIAWVGILVGFGMYYGCFMLGCVIGKYRYKYKQEIIGKANKH